MLLTVTATSVLQCRGDSAQPELIWELEQSHSLLPAPSSGPGRATPLHTNLSTSTPAAPCYTARGLTAGSTDSMQAMGPQHQLQRAPLQIPLSHHTQGMLSTGSPGKLSRKLPEGWRSSLQEHTATCVHAHRHTHIKACTEPCAATRIPVHTPVGLHAHRPGSPRGAWSRAAHSRAVQSTAVQGRRAPPSRLSAGLRAVGEGGEAAPRAKPALTETSRPGSAVTYRGKGKGRAPGTAASSSAARRGALPREGRRGDAAAAAAPGPPGGECGTAHARCRPKAAQCRSLPGALRCGPRAKKHRQRASRLCLKGPGAVKGQAPPSSACFPP